MFGGEKMKVKMLNSVAGLDFAYNQGEEVEMTKERASDLIKAKHAIPLEKETATKRKPSTRKKV